MPAGAATSVAWWRDAIAEIYAGGALRAQPVVTMLAKAIRAHDLPHPIGLAAITGTYQGTVILTDKVPPTSYGLVVEGQGRPGFVKGTSAIVLRDEGATTAVDVSASVQTGGAIARIGQRLIGSVAKMMMDRFFECLKSKLV